MADAIFLSAVKKITERNLPILELLEAAEILKAKGFSDRAVQLYSMWITYNPDAPLIHILHFNLAVLLSSSGNQNGAKDALERAIALSPDFFPAYINLGNVLEKIGSVDQAISQWSAVVNKLAPINGTGIAFKATALKQIGRVLLANQHLANAEQVLRQSIDIDKNQEDVIAQYISLRLGQCDWPVVSPWEGVSRSALMKGMGPLSIAAYTDDPMLQLASALHYYKGTVGRPPINMQAGRRPARSDRLRIGYVSSDMREHAVGYLTVEAFELHDRNAVEVFIYYCGPATTDSLNARIKAAVEHWTDISGMDDEAAARRISDDGIDILVDLNGYTRDARTKVFAMRPAPINVNWLGYPGSMGSPYHHYIIADSYIIPEDHEIYYTEKVLRLPCYQPNDRKRVIAPDRPSRAEAKLPEDAFVYCCFNGVHKITRFTFERWMTILKQVPNSVLWLLSSSEGSTKNLREFAERSGVSSERLIFADKLANPYHLARYPLADLFLDTVPYGAHTTASDALWMGVPILTLASRGFASRVCGSLARSAGLGDLVCDTPEEYIERAVALGNDRAQAQKYRDLLASNKDTCVLFDMEGLVRHLEGLYEQMYEQYRHGQLPRPDLTNLDIYHELGIEEDHEAMEVMAIEDYPAWYKARLASRHSLWPIAPDNRLWTERDIAMADETMAAESVADG